MGALGKGRGEGAGSERYKPVGQPYFVFLKVSLAI